MWHLSFLPSTTTTTTQWHLRRQPPHGALHQQQSTTKPTAHECQRLPMNANNCPWMQMIAHKCKRPPPYENNCPWQKTTTHRCQQPFMTENDCSWMEMTTHVYGMQVPHQHGNQTTNDDQCHNLSFGLVSPSHTHPNLPHWHPLAIKRQKDHTEDNTMTTTQDCDKATMKQGHTTRTHQQHATMKTCHNNATTARTQNEDTTTRPHEDNTTMRTQPKWQDEWQWRHCTSRTAVRASTIPSPSISPHHSFTPPSFPISSPIPSVPTPLPHPPPPSSPHPPSVRVRSLWRWCIPVNTIISYFRGFKTYLSVWFK